jgi:mercuric ion transport protein
MNESRLGKATLVGAVLGALGASACCLGPALLALVGLAGVGVAAAFEPYRPAFLGVSAVLLGLGFYLTY